MAVAGAFASHTPPAEGDSIACRKHRPGCRERAGHDGAPWGRQVRLDQGTCLFLLDALAPPPDEAPVFVDLLDAPAAPAAAAPTSGPDASGDEHRQTPVSCRAAGSTAVCQGSYLSVAPTVPDARHMIQRAPSAPAPSEHGLEHHNFAGANLHCVDQNWPRAAFVGVDPQVAHISAVSRWQSGGSRWTTSRVEWTCPPSRPALWLRCTPGTSHASWSGAGTLEASPTKFDRLFQR